MHNILVPNRAYLPFTFYSLPKHRTLSSVNYILPFYYIQTFCQM
jgi:hypothetical protein